MTPGFAKPRRELPWLPYSESDRVIINSHNFTPPGSRYSVNGKEPIAAWIPSLDTAGNGTTTLTDLVGSNSGTLTNMDAATDWVADTDSGGVRALDYDGLNDHVITGLNVTSLPVSIFVWVKPVVTSQFNTIIGDGDASIYIGNDNRKLRFFSSPNGVSTTSNYLVDSVWQQIGYTWDGVNVVFYYNGASVESKAMGGTFAINGLMIARYFSGPFFPYLGRIDDLRVWSVLLDATDASDLYTAQRGGQA